MPDQKLLEYIKAELAQGVGKQAIINFLLSQGWQQTQIEETLNLAQNSSVPVTVSNQISKEITKDSLFIKIIKIVLTFLFGLLAFFSVAFFPELILGLFTIAAASSGSLTFLTTIPLLAVALSIIFIITAFWLNLSRIKGGSILKTKSEAIYLLPIIGLNYVNFMIILYAVDAYILNLVDQYFRYSNYDKIGIFILPIFFFLYLFILLPKIALPKTTPKVKRKFIIIASVLSLLLSFIEISIFIFLINLAISVSPLQTTKIDETKIGDIAQFQHDIEFYYNSNQKLPQQLSDIKSQNVSKYPLSDYSYTILSDTTFKICANFSTDTSKNNYPSYDFHNQWKHNKGNKCFNFTIPEVYVKYPQKPANLDPNYQPMYLSGGFDFSRSSRSDHTLQAKVIGKNCSGTDGKNGNKTTVSFDPKFSNPYLETDRYVYSNWEIWDTGCGLEKGNPIGFTLDGKPVGIYFTDDSGSNQTCLPFLANKKMTEDGGATGSFIEIVPSSKAGSPNLDCSNVTLKNPFPIRPSGTSVFPPKLQPMIIMKGFFDYDNDQKMHTIQVQIVGKNCSETTGVVGNKLTLSSVKGVNWFSNWDIWDESCGLDKGNVVTFQIDGSPAGLSYTDDTGKAQTCLPFIANKSFINEMHVHPLSVGQKQDLDCSNVNLN